MSASTKNPSDFSMIVAAGRIVRVVEQLFMLIDFSIRFETCRREALGAPPEVVGC
jgi:hypothetical protein